MRNIHFFLDFDGTISTGDVVDLVLERFADKRWKDVEKEWAEGQIGSRECLRRQIELVKASPEDLQKLVSHVRLDPHFLAFLKKAEDLGVLVTIVSDGFDLLIEQVLRQNVHDRQWIVKGIPIFSNKLRKTGKGFEAVFPTDPCEHGCANCKAAVMRKLVAVDDNVFFVGDGWSDRFAAEKAHLTFAKGRLLAFCRDNGLENIEYVDFGKITQWLDDNHSFLRKVQVADGRR